MGYIDYSTSMPCDGPSQEYAYKRGDEATEEVLKLLLEKYHANRPPEVEPYSLTERLGADWDVLEKTLRSTLRELIWTSHCLW